MKMSNLLLKRVIEKSGKNNILAYLDTTKHLFSDCFGNNVFITTGMSYKLAKTIYIISIDTVDRRKCRVLDFTSVFNTHRFLEAYFGYMVCRLNHYMWFAVRSSNPNVAHIFDIYLLKNNRLEEIYHDFKGSFSEFTE